MGDYIKLDRKLLEWKWWHDINTTRLFLYLLLRANWKDGFFKTMTVPRGSLISSYPKLADATSLTINETRTAISHLKSTGEITVKPYSNYSVITVCNYNLYQSDHTQEHSQTTDNPQTINGRLTTIEERKNNKNIKKDIPKGISKESHFVPPTVDQVKEYCQSRSNNVDSNKFVDFYSSKGWMVGKTKMKDWKASVRTWEAKDGGVKNARSGESVGTTENGFMQKARAAGYDPSKLEFKGF